MDIARALLDGAIEGPAVWTLLDLLAVIDELFVEADLLKTLYGGPSQSPAAKLNLSASAYGCSTLGSSKAVQTPCACPLNVAVKLSEQCCVINTMCTSALACQPQAFPCEHHQWVIWHLVVVQPLALSCVNRDL